jgi:hypothetical protein
MNIYQKAVEGNEKAFRDYDARARQQPEYMSEAEAVQCLSEARADLDKAIACHSYAKAHDALWQVLCCQSRLDAIRYPNV